MIGTLLGLIPWQGWAIGAAAVAGAIIYWRWKRSIQRQAQQDQYIKSMEADRKVSDAVTEAGRKAPTSRSDVAGRLRDGKF